MTVLFVLSYWQFGDILAGTVYGLLFAVLVIVALINLETTLIPNRITVPGILVGILLSVYASRRPETGLLVDDPLASVAGALIAGAILFAYDAACMALFRLKGVGMGDVKLVAMLGSFFGIAGGATTTVLFLLTLTPVWVIQYRQQQRYLAQLAETDPEQYAMESGRGIYTLSGPFHAMAAALYILVWPYAVDALYA